ncbi:MAG: biopolymer transporter ExbD [Bdellovibrionaceae bacterium]|nr:biopolymer transporter ExbD [Pseudobdellovibrionaceae bacterium]MBX3033276.1 biopolymer transporter ExbD [Pseudobdellovibrionaceae bacterium]
MASSSKTRGSAKRLIETPGYHLHPRYDLKHLRHVLEERKRGKKDFALQLAPMVDMFSVLVIFLLMNFSTSGEVFFVGKQITIPKATKGVPMASHPLISVVGEKVMFEAPENDKGRGAVYIEEKNDGVNERLRKELRRIKEIEEKIGGTEKFKGQVNIQADEMMDADQVKKVMRVLMEEGWNVINFIFEPKPDSAARPAGAPEAV